MSVSSTYYRSNAIDLSFIKHSWAKLSHDESSFIEISDNLPITLLFIHGSDSDCTTWNVVTKELDDYRWVAFDLRGHGTSLIKNPEGNIDFSLDQMVADIERIMETNKVEKAVFVAHSLAVRIAVYYASKHPEQVQGLVLEDLHVIPREPVDLPTEKIEELQNFKTIHSTREEAVAELAKYGYEDREGRIIEQEHKYKIIRINPLVANLTRNAISASTAVKEAFCQLNLKQTPVLLLQAEKSEVSDEGLEFMKTHQPQMQHICVPGSKHNIHKTATELFIKFLKEFLEEKILPRLTTS